PGWRRRAGEYGSHLPQIERSIARWCNVKIGARGRESSESRLPDVLYIDTPRTRVLTPVAERIHHARSLLRCREFSIGSRWRQGRVPEVRRWWCRGRGSRHGGRRFVAVLQEAS